MHFELVHQPESRTRSVPLGKSVTSVAELLAGNVRPARVSYPPEPGTGTSSLPSSQENLGSTRHYRSMLDVQGRPPKLGPLKAVSFDEFFVEPVKPAGIESSARALPAVSAWFWDIICNLMSDDRSCTS